MKAKLFILVAVFFSGVVAKAQNSNMLFALNRDTTAYITRLVEQKAQYLNKPISNLLTNLKIPVVDYASTIFDDRPRATDVKGVYLVFYSDEQESVFINQKKSVPTSILVDFSPPVPKATALAIRKKYPTGTDGLIELFGQCIITDIELVK
ncbi:MAG: hypothetical protein V4592_22835 [Bacteroidota bacterium]